MRAEFSAGLMAGPITESLPPGAPWKLTEVKEGAVIMCCLGWAPGDSISPPGDPVQFTIHTRRLDRTKNSGAAGRAFGQAEIFNFVGENCFCLRGVGLP